MELKVLKVRENAILPRYAHGNEDTGADLYVSKVKYFKDGELTECLNPDGYVLQPFETILCLTGFKMEVEDGKDVQIRPTSGNSLKTPLRIPNSPATIDSGFRDEVGVIIQNVSNNRFKVNIGDKIAQMVIAKVEHPSIIEVDKLSDSNRGDNGYGSTGVAGEKKEEKSKLRYKVDDEIILKSDLKDCDKFDNHGLIYNDEMAFLKEELHKIESINNLNYYKVAGYSIVDDMIDHEKTLFLNSTTKEERNFLKLVGCFYEWIAKDESGEVYIYGEKPYRDTGAKKVYWFTCGAEVVSDLQFLNLKWEHLGIDQPVKIFR